MNNSFRDLNAAIWGNPELYLEKKKFESFLYGLRDVFYKVEDQAELLLSQCYSQRSSDHSFDHLTESGKEFNLNQVYGDRIRAAENLIRYNRNSIVLILYAEAEISFNKVLKHLKKEFSIRDSLKRKRSESQVNFVQRFLEDSVQIDLGSEPIKSYFDKYSGFNDLRNCLAHRNGLVKDQEEVIEFKKLNLTIVQIDGFNTVQFRVRKDVLDLIEAIGNFHTSVVEIANSKWKKEKNHTPPVLRNEDSDEGPTGK